MPEPPKIIKKRIQPAKPTAKLDMAKYFELQKKKDGGLNEKTFEVSAEAVEKVNALVSDMFFKGKICLPGYNTFSDTY